MNKNEEKSLLLFPEPPILTLDPQWEFISLPYIDFISDEPTSVVAYIFQIEILEKVSGIYSWPVFQALLAGLCHLSRSKNKKLRESAFTIFAGDIFEYNIFVLALETKSKDINNFMIPYFEKVNGYFSLEASSSTNLLPMFRYDKGYVIEYSDSGLEGTAYVDTQEYFGSGLKIYRRIWALPENIGRKKSCYGRLLKNP